MRGPFLGLIGVVFACGGTQAPIYARATATPVASTSIAAAPTPHPSAPSDPQATLAISATANTEPAALTPEEVSAAVQSNEPELIACYTRWAERPSEQRRMDFTIDLAVDRDGRVAMVKAIPRNPARLAACLENRISRWTLPAAREASVFHFPVRFDPIAHARMTTPRFFAELTTRFDNELCDHPRLSQCASGTPTQCQTLVEEALVTCQEEAEEGLGHHVELNENGSVARRFSQCVARSYVMTLLVEGEWRQTAECSAAFSDFGGA